MRKLIQFGQVMAGVIIQQEKNILKYNQLKNDLLLSMVMGIRNLLLYEQNIYWTQVRRTYAE